MIRTLVFAVVGMVSLVSMAGTCGFDAGKDGWNLWGEGSGSHIKGLGRAKPGCLFMECGFGQQMTIHKKHKLKPGRYLVTFWIRAFGVEAGQWNYSIWAFYDVGKGTQSPIKDLRGTFEWSRLSFTIDVADKPADIWLRLKAQGSMWVDDISVTPHQGKPIACNFAKSTKAFPRPNPVGEGVRCSGCYRWMDKGKKRCILCGKLLGRTAGPMAQKSGPEEKLLLGFEAEMAESERGRHNFPEFNEENASQGTRAAITKYGRYNNLNLSDAFMQDWSGYDYLAVDVFNPTKVNVTFATTINDGKGSGYWNQLNHYSTIAPGWNKLRFHVNRYVGERGSVRVKRYLDLRRIKTLWMAVHPEGKLGLKGDFLLDNIRLVKAPAPPKPFEGLMLFDFVKEDFRTQRGFTGVMTKHNYHKDVGFGFWNAAIWRAEDSLYADSLHRDGIFINRGEFRVDLPNGEYVVRLVPFHLGVWTEHFWTHRKVVIEGHTVLDEKRTKAEDYERVFLQFANTEPTPDDSAFELYLERIYKPLTTTVKVVDGQLNITFNGDNSGLCANSLIIYPVKKHAEAEKFIAGLNKVREDEFKNTCTQLPTFEINEVSEFSARDKENGFYSALVGSDKQIRFNQIFKAVASKIELQGGHGERPVQAMIVRNLRSDALLRITGSPLKSSTGVVIEPEPAWMRYAVSQYQSHSLNHETYELAPRYLRDFTQKGTPAPKNSSMLIWYQVPIHARYKAGVYTGTIEVRMHDNVVTYPVELRVHPFVLPPVDIALGWFGIDPIGYQYFRGAGVAARKRRNRERVLKALHERGFATFSASPGFSYVRDGADLKVVADELDHLMATARKLGFSKKVFTYGGGFNRALHLDKHRGPINGLAYEDFRRLSAKALKVHIKEKNWLPIVVDFSDEASGYSQMVDRDLKRARVLEKWYPFLRRGGFTHAISKGKYGYDLNQTFTDVSISHHSKEFRSDLKRRGRRWGHYNMAQGLFTNDRQIGRSLYSKSKHGCDHHLGWYLTLAQNLPYYDLDGRESDAMMIFPRLDGEFEYALKFEWAAQGVEDYRLLLLLERLVAKNPSKAAVAQGWLKAYQNDSLVRGEEGGTETFVQYQRFRKEIYRHILSLM